MPGKKVQVKNNLSDEQIKALIKMGNRVMVLAAAVAIIGLTGTSGLIAVGLLAFFYLLFTKA